MDKQNIEYITSFEESICPNFENKLQTESEQIKFWITRWLYICLHFIWDCLYVL